MSNPGDNPGFDRLKKIFKQFAAGQATPDRGLKAVRALSAGGKALLDKVQEEFPPELVAKIADDFYKLLESADVADAVSLSVRSFDEQKVKELLSEAVVLLQDDEYAKIFARAFKMSLQKSSNADIARAVDYALASRPVAVRWVVKAFFDQVKPYIDDMRDAPQEEIALKIQELAKKLPLDLIARQVAGYTHAATPERMGQTMKDIVAKQPKPEALSGMAHDLARLTAAKLGDMSQAQSLDDVRKIAAALSNEAEIAVKKVIAQDNKPQKPPKRRGGFGGLF